MIGTGSGFRQAVNRLRARTIPVAARLIRRMWASATIEQAASSLWKNPTIDVALWVSAIFAWIFLYRNPQPPGTAAVMLAAWATVMTFRDMKSAQKIVGIIVIAFFAILELRSIHYDHIAQDSARSAEQKDMQDRFSTVLQQNQKAFDATERHIETAINQSENIFNNVSGGDSFVYVVPSENSVKKCLNGPDIKPKCIDNVSLVAVNGGDYPMRGISIDVALNDYLSPQPNSATKFIPTMRIVELPAHGSEFLSGTIKPYLEKEGTLRYVVSISAENGSIKETIDFYVYPGSESKSLMAYPYVRARYRVSRMEQVKGEPNVETERILAYSDWY